MNPEKEPMREIIREKQYFQPYDRKQTMPKKSDEKRDAFSQKMIGILNAGALNLALAVGYRTGLFDVMDRFDAPRSIEKIAEISGLNERYIREWLGIMVTGGIAELTLDAAGNPLYFLPKEHGDLLTRRAGSSNLGVYTQEIPLLTVCATEGVIRGFETGDGVPYSAYPRFQAFMSELGNAKHRRVLTDTFLPSADGGKLLIRLKEGIRVCDLGCGEGIATILMAAAFPRSSFVGIDMDEAVIRTARESAAGHGLDNIEFAVRDAALLDRDGAWENAFDYVTAFDAIHDQTDPAGALRGVRHILCPGGAFSMVDIAAGSEHADNLNHPLGPFLYTVSLMHCMPVGLVSRGAGLGMMWGRQKAESMLRDAGFSEINVSEIPEDSFNLHYFCRK